MRIAFLLGGLGLGGVADYTRLLAGALRAHGVESLIIALADRERAAVASEVSADARMLALPAGLPWRARVAAAEAALADFDPDWVSLQFVPFAFNRKGIVALEGRWLARLLAGRRVHLMVHELWVEPLPRPVGPRRRLLRWMQRAAILRLLERTRPELVHTSNEVYRQLLGAAGVAAGLLPLFGNVPVEARPDRGWLEQALSAAGHDPARRPMLFGFFGGIAPQWEGTDLFSRLSRTLERMGREGVVLSAGAAGALEERMDLWRRRHPRLGFLALGIQPAERISCYLQALDAGLTSYPQALIGKSSSVVAMLEHGVPVILDWGDLRPELPAIDPEFADLVLRPGGDLDAFVRAPSARQVRGSRLPMVAAAMMGDLDPGARLRKRG